ncbi:probable ubiquitin carboxyl-terminal hydrolase FAF-X isoform X3 [Planococcus citri]|uniref:probable ubiquitin carboxyl-terminal hydrolase FAF-X isoform X3 n=1 Tax=Planococcus citri TaxID=170843 RepID=UPI0031F9300D
MTIVTQAQGVGLQSPDEANEITSLHQAPTHIPGIGGSPSSAEYTGYGPHLPDQPVGDNNAEQKDDSSAAPCSCGSSTFPAEQNEFPPFKEDPSFPHNQLASLEDKINNTKWVIPVLPEQELEILLDAAIELCRTGEDSKSEACQRFFRDSMAICINKIMTDEAVGGWKYTIHHCIYDNCLRFIEICALKIKEDWLPLLDLLALVLNPCNKFHTVNAMRPSETISIGQTYPDDYLFARPALDTRPSRGWLVDMLNKFGEHGGFQGLLDRFKSGKPLTIPVVFALIRPFGFCHELLTVHTIATYFLPIIEMIPEALKNLTDEELKREVKNESKNDVISTIIRSCRCLLSRVPNQEEKMREFEMFRLKMLLRLLQISSFNGKMNALNEVNKLIAGISYFPNRHSSMDHENEEWLTSERMAKWIKENNVLEIVLRDSLHQPQYVEKLEKILRFIIKEKALTLEDLDAVWAAQSGKHDAIVKNVHDLLAKLAWDFSPEQLDHLFGCFQASWSTANKKQTEKLLELIRRLAEDDKDGVMAQKVLTLFWNLAHKEDVLPEILDQALSAHVKILDYSCSQDRDVQKTSWINKCVEELKNESNWVLPALKLIKDICSLYEPSSNIGHTQRQHVFHRQEIIEKLQRQYSLIVLVTENLASYIESVRQVVKDHPDLDPSTYYPDKRYNHIQQVQERLSFLRFLLKDGRLCLCNEQARQIWECLAEKNVFDCDREACFKWFSKIMGEIPDLEPDIYKDFFESNVLQFDPAQLTESGMKCFERFFKTVNSKEGKLRQKRRDYQTDDLDLIGTEYLWRVLTYGGDAIANRAIELLKEVNTNLGPRLQTSLCDFHDNHISECINRLRALYDTISILSKQDSSCMESNEGPVKNPIRKESVRMCRILRVLYEYINECDNNFASERKLLPLYRAGRGKHVALIVRFANTGRQPDEIELVLHGNMTVGCLRKQILRKLKSISNNLKVELYANGEMLDPIDDKRLISDIPAIKDKSLLTAKLVQGSGNLVSSPDSSSDSSTGSPHHALDLSPNEDEMYLPGVIISRNEQYTQFFFQIADRGSELGDSDLRDAARNILRIIPPDQNTVENLYILFCNPEIDPQDESVQLPTLESMFFGPSPSQVLYNIEVLYTLLMPTYDPQTDKTVDFQFAFLCSDKAQVALEMLTKNNFLPRADVATKRAAFLTVLKICYVLLSVVGHIAYKVAESSRNYLIESSPQSEDGFATNNALILIKDAFYSLPIHSTDSAVRSLVACKVAQKFIDEVYMNTRCIEFHSSIIDEGVKCSIPRLETIRAIIRLAWACAGGNMQLLVDSAGTDMLHVALQENEPEEEDVLVCREALELLPICMILNRLALDNLHGEKLWPHFIIDLVLIARNRAIRYFASEQILLMMSFSHSQPPLLNCISLLFNVLNKDIVTENGSSAFEYFHLLCRLISVVQQRECILPNIEELLNSEIAWLKMVKDNVKRSGTLLVDEILLEGHLGITKELLRCMSPEKKYFYGSDENSSVKLVKELIEDFIFPASKQMLHFEKTKETVLERAIPVCNTPQSLDSAFDLLVTLCMGCASNLRLVVQMLCDMFYSDRDAPLVEWDYLPPVGPRPLTGFAGLKNAGATCYMNSVIQQLYMVESIRVNILAAEGAATDPNEDFSGEDRYDLDQSPVDTVDGDEKCSVDDARKKYNINILKEVQAIFGHLACSKLQYYVPKGLWRNFRLQGEPVNLREQQDAVEFFMSLIESIDEALKALNHEQTMSKVLGGSFSDQKICKGCPHRYCREEPFSVISVDMRNHSNLLDSLEQYVKGELLEGVDAYHCDKCDKKVETVKRLCVKKLPPVLTIQLKRFEYDFERVCAIKFNDYFEFPRNLDMEPYTVSGLAKVEGELIDCDNISPDGSSDSNNIEEVCTKYQLTGIVVHSGQASGGHYYSYILHRHSDGSSKWYKFDDGDVSECKMEDDEEMKSQCFGGDYMGEVFDQMLKRMSYRRQKRWWNAYMLFYTRLDVQEEPLVNNLKQLSLSESRLSLLKMPEPIEKSVIRQNIKFMHNRNQFSQEYFHFMKRIAICNTPTNHQNACDMFSDSVMEELSLLTVQLVSKFLFHTGFHTKKALRGPASDWWEVLNFHLKSYSSVRRWFAYNILLEHPHRFCEYLLSCPSAEVRTAFIKIVAHLAHYSVKDPVPSASSTPSIFFDTTSPLSDQILITALQLLNKEISDHGRHLSHYFTLFQIYCGFGTTERQQLLRLNVPCLFLLVTLDEGPGPAIKYQYTELNKCHAVISTLIRCCDVRSQCNPFQGAPMLPNPYAEYSNDSYIMELQPQVQEILYNRISYVKKLIEEVQLTEDTLKLLQFVSWENPHMSKTILSEVLWHIAFAYCNELKHHIEMLLALLRMEDSWQQHRISNALKGLSPDRDGLFEITFRSKTHYQKRSYQCIKCMVMLFSKCRLAHNMLNSDPNLKKKWWQAVEWLNEELDRRPFVSSPPYNYANWQSTSSVPSNDTANGYLLERSNSAKKTLEKALEICPDTEGDTDEQSDDGESSQTEELTPNEIHPPQPVVKGVQRIPWFKSERFQVHDSEVSGSNFSNRSPPQRLNLRETNTSPVQSGVPVELPLSAIEAPNEDGGESSKSSVTCFEQTDKLNGVKRKPITESNSQQTSSSTDVS